MKWNLKWAEHLATGFYARLYEKGLLKPEDYEPDIGPFEFYMIAFRELSTTRLGGMGPTPIPVTAIMQYSELIKVEDFDDFHYIIRRLDDSLLESLADKNKSKGQKNGSGNTGPANSNRHRRKG